MSNWSDFKNNPRLREMYKKRIAIIRLIREFFWSRDFLETDTPIAVRYPGQEPYLNPVPSDFHHPDGRRERFYLHTSPEFAMKKLLAAGYEKIFQICHCFRDYEDWGGLHNTEFTMLEWYRSPGTLEEIMNDTETLWKFVAGELGIQRLKNCDLRGQWDRVSMKELWQKYLSVDLDKYLAVEQLNHLAVSLGLQVEVSDTYDDLFFKIFLNKIEPHLGQEHPIFVYDYPAQMCSLSKLCEHDRRYAQRFELYINGLELANAFGELTDAAEQKRLLEGDLNRRLALGKDTWPVDQDFIAALRSWPASVQTESGLRRGAAGIALGVDRMVLLFAEARDINEVIFQSVGDQIN